MLICSIKYRILAKKMIILKKSACKQIFLMEEYEAIKRLFAESPLTDFVILVFRPNFQPAL
jgi:hypothetical protein